MSRRKIKGQRRAVSASDFGGIRTASIYPTRGAAGDFELLTYISPPIDEADCCWAEEYHRAHLLMPRDYYYDPDDSASLVHEAVTLLASSTAGERATRRAIAILGHSPCEAALTALEAYGQTDRPFAGIARLAYSECAGLAAGPVDWGDPVSA